MILAYTSARIDYIRPTDNALSARMEELLRARELAVTEPVLMEVLAGARSDAAVERLDELPRAQRTLPLDPETDFVTAATFSRLCRRIGITLRGLLDCVITAVAWRTGSQILTADRDLARMGSVVGVPVERL